MRDLLRIYPAVAAGMNGAIPARISAGRKTAFEDDTHLDAQRTATDTQAIVRVEDNVEPT